MEAIETLYSSLKNNPILCVKNTDLSNMASMLSPWAFYFPGSDLPLQFCCV